eukprot:11414311-Alexandrium_andersonii.AAC.1
MSASLVGSEMCIRDRPFAADFLRAAPRMWTCWWAAGGKYGNTTGTPQPVSYTHLTLPTICSV